MQVSTSRLVLEKMLAWKWLGTANPPMPVDSADLLVVLWVADGSEGDGLQLIRGEEGAGGGNGQDCVCRFVLLWELVPPFLDPC